MSLGVQIERNNRHRGRKKKKGQHSSPNNMQMGFKTKTKLANPFMCKVVFAHTVTKYSFSVNSFIKIRIILLKTTKLTSFLGTDTNTYMKMFYIIFPLL